MLCAAVSAMSGVSPRLKLSCPVHVLAFPCSFVLVVSEAGCCVVESTADLLYGTHVTCAGGRESCTSPANRPCLLLGLFVRALKRQWSFWLVSDLVYLVVLDTAGREIHHHLPMLLWP